MSPSHLFHGAEDVSVVLLEAPHPGKACEGSGELVPVEHPEVSQPDGKLPPGARPVGEHQAGGAAQREQGGRWAQEQNKEGLTIKSDYTKASCVIPCCEVYNSKPQLPYQDSL